MRILAAADIHGAHTVYEWLAGLSHRGVDVLVLAGDLLAADFEDEQRKQAGEIVGLLKTIPIPVAYLMGNDDNVALDYEDELVKPIHGRRVQFGGYAFVGYQYSPPFVGDVFVKTEDKIAADLERLEPLLDSKTVLVTHSPAWGHRDLVFGENVGSQAITSLVQRNTPLAHIHGHIHGAFGRDGIHFNVASAGMRRAMLIELPSLTYSVLDHRTTQL
jgi:Icc-related predicted phosphoesterase